jgi:RNA polymerase sigma-70 factor (ECF subfamily)
MTHSSERAAEFERHRARLFGLAYRMLGSVDDARDVLQEAYLRWHEADVVGLRSAEAWLVSVATRLSIDRLRRAATERAAYVGPWLPHPIATEGPGVDPEEAASLTRDASMALLVLLERLGPEERAAFVLREVCERDYAEIAAALNKNEAACRKLVQRAKERVRTPLAPHPREGAQRAVLLDSFASALRRRDADALLGLLADDVRFVSDGGGTVFASRRVLEGSARVVRILLNLERKFGIFDERHTALINGELALVSVRGGALRSVTALDVSGERIRAIYRVLNPDKLKFSQPARGYGAQMG